MGTIKAKDIGLVMLGAGVLILSLVALHFYLTTVLPHTSGARFGAYCQSWDEKTAVITVSNYGDEELKDVNVFVNDELACRLSDIPPDSSDICRVSVDENTAVFRVIAATSSGRLLKDAGICVMYESVVPGAID